MKFSHFFIDRPIFAAVLSLLIIVVAGALALLRLPISEYPQVVPPTVVVRAHLSRRQPEGHRRDRRRRRSSSRSTASRTCSTCPRRRPPTAA